MQNSLILQKHTRLFKPVLKLIWLSFKLDSKTNECPIFAILRILCDAWYKNSQILQKRTSLFKPTSKLMWLVQFQN
jgi:hypothetical protein